MSPVKLIPVSLLLVTLLIGGVAARLAWNRIDAHFRDIEHAALDDRRRQLDTLAHSLAYLIDINEASIDSLARDNEVVDLLEFGDPETVMAWTTRQRRHIPMGFGLGIIDSAGRLIGDKHHQRIGLACLSDARRIFAGTDTPRPLIHNDISGLEHYDVIKPVADAEGRVVGHLLASYRLGVFDGWLDHMQRERALARVELADGAGQVLSSRGSRPDSAHRIELAAAVPGTQLELRGVVSRPPPAPLPAELSRIAAIAALLVLAAVIGALLAVRRSQHGRSGAPTA